MLATIQRAGLVGLNRNEIRSVTVIGFGRLSLGCRMNHLVTIGTHSLQYFQFPGHNLTVTLPANKFQVCPPAKNGIAIRHAVSLKPVPVFVHHCRAGGLKELVGNLFLPKKRPNQQHGNELIAGFVEVNPVDGVRSLATFRSTAGLKGICGWTK